MDAETLIQPDFRTRRPLLLPDFLLAEYAEIAPLFRTSTLEQLIDAYSEPGRYYHNLSHLRTLLRLFRDVRDFADDPKAVKAAIFFHDAIYHIPMTPDMPPPRDNEDRSARFMFMQAINPLNRSLIAASHIIRNTSTHDAGETNESKLMHDLDLSILAVRMSRYAAYERALRQEYAAYPQPLYCAARLGILRGYLDRQRLYSIPYFAAKWDSKARNNLQWAIGQLSEGKIPGQL